jgi:hypothetical protein
MDVAGLSGLTQDNVGDMLTITGSAHRENNDTFQIVRVTSAFTCTVVNASGIVDAGPLGWSISRYGWMPPALALGSPGTVWGEGETLTPSKDTGSNSRGLWRPTTIPGIGQRPTYSWGLRISSLEIETVRGLVKAWKSARTYYPNLIVCYGAPASFSPTGSAPYNPDGNFGSVGVNVGGVWRPTRFVASNFDAYCQGTGQAIACGVENIT